MESCISFYQFGYLQDFSFFFFITLWHDDLSSAHCHSYLHLLSMWVEIIINLSTKEKEKGDTVLKNRPSRMQINHWDSNINKSVALIINIHCCFAGKVISWRAGGVLNGNVMVNKIGPYFLVDIVIYYSWMNSYSEKYGYFVCSLKQYKE